MQLLSEFDRYRRLSIPKLSSGVEDAKGVARVLKDRGFKVIELYNESATRVYDS